MSTCSGNTERTESAPPSSGDTAVQIHKPKNQSESAVIDRVLGDSLKLLAVAGTFVYGALFMSYRAYYSAIGIRAEDVGVNHAFILSRSIAFIFLAAIVAGAIGIFAWVIGRREGIWGWDRLWIFVAFILVVGYACLLLIPTKSPLWLDVVSFVVILSAGIALGCQAEAGAETGKRQPARYIGIALAVLLTVLLPGVAIGMRAHELGEKAMVGRSVTPLKILEIPVLDVSTEQIGARWICRERERPPIFGNGSKGGIVEGTLLGETSTNVFIRLQQQADGERRHYPQRENIIIKLPQECVMVVRSEDFSEADAL